MHGAMCVCVYMSKKGSTLKSTTYNSGAHVASGAAKPKGQATRIAVRLGLASEVDGEVPPRRDH